MNNQRGNSTRVEILNTRSKDLRHDYVAFNVVGLISASTIQRMGPGSDVVEGFAVDDSLSKKPALFRLRESVNAIVVSEVVKKGVEEARFKTLTFTPTENWVG